MGGGRTACHVEVVGLRKDGCSMLEAFTRIAMHSTWDGRDGPRYCSLNFYLVQL